MKDSTPLNVLGEPLRPCSTDPLTGFYRDGCCNTGPEDHGCHTVCVVLNETFLKFSKSRGNDLSSPRPEFGFPGLNQGTVGVYALTGGKKPIHSMQLQMLF